MPTKQFIKSNPRLSAIELPEQGMTKKDFLDSFKQYYIHLLGRDETAGRPIMPLKRCP